MALKKDFIASIIIGVMSSVFLFFIGKLLSVKIFQEWILFIFFPLLTTSFLFIAYFLGKKFFIIYQFAKFILVGLTNVIIDLGILNILMFAFKAYSGINFSIFKIISFIASSINSYFLNKFWTFQKNDSLFKYVEYMKFLTIMTISLLVNIFISSSIVNIIGPQFGISEKLWANIAAISAGFVVVTWNFISSKFIVFKNRNN